MHVHTTIEMPNGPGLEKKPEEKPEFWTYMLSLSQEDWKNHIVYLTRENPKTSINGIGGYLTKIQQPFDIEDIKLAYGGYEFSYIMKRGNDLAYSGRFRVEAPPKYDPARESGAPAAPTNGGGSTLDGNVLKVLEQQNERLYAVLTTLQGAKGENPAIASAVEILTSAYKTGLTAVAGQPGGAAGDATKQLESVLSLAEKIVSIRGNGGGGSLTEVITLLKSLNVLAVPKTLAEQIADAKALQELVGGGGEPKDWKAAAVQAATQHLPEILDAFKAPAAAAQARAAEAQSRARAAETLRTVPIHQNPQQPAAVAPPAPGPTIHVEGGLRLEPRDAVAVEHPVVEVLPTQPAPVPVSQEQYDEGLKVQVVNMFRYGASGSAIAAFLEDIKPQMAQDLVTYPAQTITEFFSQDPILKFMVADPRWNEVLTDAREFLSEEPVPAVN